MSHIVTVRTQVRDPVALAAACRRLGLEPPALGVTQLYSGRAEGLLVKLPNWRYTVVFDTTSGQIQYDNYGGHWGDPKTLDKLLQIYGVEKTKREARRSGHLVHEQPQLDGSIKLLIQDQGGGR